MDAGVTLVGSAWPLLVNTGRQRRGSRASAIKCLHLLVTARHAAMPKLEVAQWNHRMRPERRPSMSSTRVRCPPWDGQSETPVKPQWGRPSLSSAFPKRLPGALVTFIEHLLSVQGSVSVTTFNPQNDTVGRHRYPPPFYR